jgi:hypothetical protein
VILNIIVRRTWQSREAHIMVARKERGCVSFLGKAFTDSSQRYALLIS